MKYYNKLVRDRIPEMIERDGRVPDIKILSAERYHEYLDDKIQEELTEYRASREHIELMDIVEVVQAIVERRRQLGRFRSGEKRATERARRLCEARLATFRSVAIPECDRSKPTNAGATSA